MGLFEESYITVKTFIGDVARKAGDTIEVQKVKLAIAQLVDKLEQQFAELGEITYKELTSDQPVEGAEEQKAEIVEAIKELKVQISDKKTDLDILQNNITCEECGQANAAGAKFCNNCGKQL